MNKTPQMKLVINTNVNYKIALNTLLQSLVDINFKAWDHVIVVLSGSDTDASPYKEQLKNISSIDNSSEVVVIKSKMDNYDYTGFHCLHLYKSDILLDSEYYFYALDTMIMTEDFLTTFYDFPFKKEGKEVYRPDGFFSNIVLFKKELVDRYKENFNFIVNKREATVLEKHGVYERNGKKVFRVDRFGELEILNKREKIKPAMDVYNIGYKRRRFLYPDFGIIKFIFPILKNKGDFVESIGRRKHD